MENEQSQSMPRRILVGRLRKFCVEALVKTGMEVAAATTVADVLVMTDTWGISSHGVGALHNYVRCLAAGGIDAHAAPEVVNEGSSWAIVDAHSGMGMLAARLAVETAIRKAQDQTIAWVGVKNSSHFGAAGYYANLAVERKMIGIAMSNADPNMVVPGGRGNLIGNNPLACGIPAGDEYPILLDIALSAVAAGKIIAMKALGQPIPAGWLTDAEGLPATEVGDWPSLGSMFPMAGHKGYGIALLIEVLAAVLSGAAVLDEAKSWILQPGIHAGLGHAFVVINPAAIMPIGDFEALIDEIIRKIRTSARAKDSARIYLPGEMEWERRSNALAHGLSLPENVLDALYGAAQELDIDIGILGGS